MVHAKLTNDDPVLCNWAKSRDLRQARCREIPRYLGIFLSTWINCNLSWIGDHMPSKLWDEITYPFPNLNSCAVEVWKWINNDIPHFIMAVITYTSWDQS